MKKTLFTAVCATALLIGATNLKANEMPPPPPPGAEMDMPHHRGMGPRRGDFGGPEMRKEHAEKFAKELGLTEEQKAQAEKLREEGRKKMEPLMKEMKDLRERMDAERKANMEEFEKILTPEQKEKLEAKKEEGRKKFEEMRKERKEGNKGEGRKGEGKKRDKK